MYQYCLYGFKLISDLEFPQLVPATEDMPEVPVIYITASDIPNEIKHITDKKYEFGDTFSWLRNTTVWIMVTNGTQINYCLTGNGNPSYLQTYLLGLGMSMLALQRDVLAIHCSAVADENGAVLIAGESGAGKSTVTTAFLEKGYRLMADDMALVEYTEAKGTLAHPAFPFQKLCRNVALEKGFSLDELIYINEEKDKFLVPYKGVFSLEAVPVKAFIMLVALDTENVKAEEITGFSKFPIYANNLFLRHLLKQNKYAPKIGQKCLQMATNVPTYTVIRPLTSDTTNQVISKIFELVE